MLKDFVELWCCVIITFFESLLLTDLVSVKYTANTRKYSVKIANTRHVITQLEPMYSVAQVASIYHTHWPPEPYTLSPNPSLSDVLLLCLVLCFC